MKEQLTAKIVVAREIDSLSFGNYWETFEKSIFKISGSAIEKVSKEPSEVDDQELVQKASIAF